MCLGSVRHRVLVRDALCNYGATVVERRALRGVQGANNTVMRRDLGYVHGADAFHGEDLLARHVVPPRLNLWRWYVKRT